MRKRRSFSDKIKNFFWQELDEHGNPIKVNEYEKKHKIAYEEHGEEIKIYVAGHNLRITDHRKERELKEKNMFAAAVLIFSVFVFSFSGYLFASYWTGDETSFPDIVSILPMPTPAEDVEDNIIELLVIGVDAGHDGVERADTIMLAFINTTNPQVTLLSIPRDTRLVIPGRGNDKINHAQAFGGQELLIETVNHFFDIEIEKYVKLNFDGFKSVVDILGAIEYDVEIRMFYPAEGIDLRPGVQMLDGDKALQFVRFRGATGDIGRVERQQSFMMEFLNQNLVPRNISRIPELVAAMNRNISTNLTIGEMVTIGMIARELEVENVRTEILPGRPDYINGVSYWIPGTQSLDDIFPPDDEGEDEYDEEYDEEPEEDRVAVSDL